MTLGGSRTRPETAKKSSGSYLCRMRYDVYDRTCGMRKVKAQEYETREYQARGDGRGGNPSAKERLQPVRHSRHRRRHRQRSRGSDTFRCPLRELGKRLRSVQAPIEALMPGFYCLLTWSSSCPVFSAADEIAHAELVHGSALG
jgi:hypothetical protein